VKNELGLRSAGAVHYSHLPAYEDGTEFPETSAYKIQKPGDYPEESIQHLEQGESLKSRIILSCYLFPCLPSGRFPRCFPVSLVLALFTGSKQISFPKQQQVNCADYPSRYQAGIEMIKKNYYTMNML
jgi:hypothetical protein